MKIAFEPLYDVLLCMWVWVSVYILCAHGGNNNILRAAFNVVLSRAKMWFARPQLHSNEYKRTHRHKRMNSLGITHTLSLSRPHHTRTCTRILQFLKVAIEYLQALDIPISFFFPNDGISPAAVFAAQQTRRKDVANSSTRIKSNNIQHIMITIAIIIVYD